MRIKRYALWVILGLILVVFPSRAEAEWVNISARLPESDIRLVAPDYQHPNVLYVASERGLYKTVDGKSWAQVFVLWGFTNKIQSIYLDPSKAGRIYLAVSNGVWKSENFGKNWELFYQGIDSGSKNVFCVVEAPSKIDELWLGTENGLMTVNTVTKEIKKVSTFPNIAVHAILISDLGTDKMLVLGVDGIYQSLDHGFHWQRTLPFAAPETTGSDSLQQVGIEEFSLTPSLSNMIYQPGLHEFMASTPRGIYRAAPEEPAWRLLEGNGVDGRDINYLAASPKLSYIATNRGVFLWDPACHRLSDISSGLASKEVHMVYYDETADRLLAATKRGLYQWLHPENLAAKPASLKTQESRIREEKNPPSSLSAKDVLKRFEAEPTIEEIQKAAIEYAEVHPRKIQAWRTAAQRKALFPTLSFSKRINYNQNIDIDRGGTADPDKFIKGPDETSGDWSVDVSWNLGELIWNNDQTSIDSRSKLMAELRDDVLNEVTHLYYERRRLQVDQILNPEPDASAQMEKQLRLDELTAGIDGLTGGYLSARLHRFQRPILAPVRQQTPYNPALQSIESDNN